MPREFHTDIDLKGGLLLNGSQGTLGQIPVSQGPNQRPVWGGPGGGLVGVTATQTLTNKTLTSPVFGGSITEGVFTITDAIGFEINPANGTIQLVVLGANRTPKGTNFLAGQSVTLMVDDGTARTLTWTDATWGGTGVRWVGGTAPTLATTGYSVMQLWKVGTQVYGMSVGNVA